MKFLFRYLREHLHLILMQMLFVCIFMVIFCLYHLPVAAILYPAGLCLFIGILFFAVSVHKTYKKHEKRMVIRTLHPATMCEFFQNDPNMEEEDYEQILLQVCREMQMMEDRMAESEKEMMDYFTVWVHQIKTPIASMQLHLNTEDSPLSRRLASDLLHIEQYVEMALTYLKLDADASDYVFREVSLDDILKENIRKLRRDFIMKKLNLHYTPVGMMVVSDEKWLSFVIEQILSNALKYTNEGSVTISFEQLETLCISDTGIGIAQEDLPRVFEKGYTGNNGRMDKRASGLGLYLCKQICDRLGHGISIFSEEDVGTMVRINFSHINLTKM
ncbi:MAG: sensor histidine kinase [Lachnospiraceae bacterium]|nr:sensor histidine kinase [Lachnospiraceae bacterium]